MDAAALDALTVVVLLDEPHPASSAAAATVAGGVVRPICSLRELIVAHIDARAYGVLPSGVLARLRV